MLCALYARGAATALAGQLDRGERALVRAVAAIGFREVPEADLRAVDPSGASFVNVNTPQDLSGLADHVPGDRNAEES